MSPANKTHGLVGSDGEAMRGGGLDSGIPAMAEILKSEEFLLCFLLLVWAENCALFSSSFLCQ
jgi:hypothetical protein